MTKRVWELIAKIITPFNLVCMIGLLYRRQQIFVIYQTTNTEEILNRLKFQSVPFELTSPCLALMFLLGASIVAGLYLILLDIYEKIKKKQFKELK